MEGWSEGALGIPFLLVSLQLLNNKVIILNNKSGL